MNIREIKKICKVCQEFTHNGNKKMCWRCGSKFVSTSSYKTTSQFNYDGSFILKLEKVGK